MAYSGTIRRLLISSPSDVPQEDLSIVRKTVNHWNGIYGASFSTAVLPISWGEHSAAEFGDAPQTILNQQIVDTCDGCIAIFANRLGTPTGSAESGTAEEIKRLASAGKYVAILRSRRFVNAADLDHAQAQSLDEYLNDISKNALMLSYAADDELMKHVNNILVQAVTRDTERAQLQREATLPASEVWPRLESSEKIKTNSKGRVTTSRRWVLVLHNSGSAPARNVRFHIDDRSWDEAIPSETVPSIAPNSDVKFIVAAHMGMAQQAQCTVTWDDGGTSHENIATLRLV